MTLREASVGQLCDALTRPDGLQVVLAGAAVSSVAPSCLPDAASWVHSILMLLRDASNLSISLDITPATFVDDDTGRLSIPLEAALTVIEDVTPGIGTKIAECVAENVPVNSLHRWIAQLMASGSTRVLTTNFDLLLEQAYRDIKGSDIRRWNVDSDWVDGAELFKLHGSADAPHTLRHTLRSINRRTSHEIMGRLTALTSNQLVVLGYAGEDYDVSEIFGACPDPLADTGPVFWLEVPWRPTPKCAELLSARREVFIIRGTFKDLLSEAGISGGDYMPDGRHIWDFVTRACSPITREQARDILLPLLYQSRVAQPSTQRMFRDYRDALRFSDDPHSRRLAHRAAAAEAQHDAGIGVNLIRASWHFVRAARRETLYRTVSDVADAVQRIGHGAFLPGRALAIPIHWLAAWQAVGQERTLLRMRFATSLCLLPIPRVILGVLNRELGSGQHDTYVEGLILRRRALMRAALGDAGWRTDLDDAEQRFRFENRTVEIGLVKRTAGQCALSVGRSEEGRKLLTDALRFQRSHGQSVQQAETALLLRLVNVAPKLARSVARYA